MTDTNAVSTIQNKPPIYVLREKIIARREELKNALGPDIDVDRFIRSLITAAQLNPDLLACSFQSLWLSIMKATRDGLLPDGREGAIVAYKSSAQWLPMVGGLLKRFRQSGECKWITADVVRQGEEFEHYVDETGEHFRHTPADDETAPITRVYACAITRSGGFHVVCLSKAEIDKIRQMSRATREDSPWSKWYSEMAKKTALRRLSKVLPSGRDIIDDEFDTPSLVPSQATPIAPVERPRTAAAALDQFANAPRPGAGNPSEAGAELGGGDAQSSSSGPTVDESDVAAVVTE